MVLYCHVLFFILFTLRLFIFLFLLSFFFFYLSLLTILSLFFFFFFFYSSADHRNLPLLTHSFPTRRSSDLLHRGRFVLYFSTRSLRPLPVLKAAYFLAGMVIVAPVPGLTPLRAER